MSQILSRVLKPLVYKNILVSLSLISIYDNLTTPFSCRVIRSTYSYNYIFFQKHNNKMVRWCSSTPIYPYLLIDHLLKVEDSSDGPVTRRSGSDGENEIVIKSKFLVEKVCNAMTIGCNKSGVIIHMKEKKYLHDTRQNSSKHLLQAL